MLVSAKWQMMWLESQYCSKSIVNWPLPSQQTQKILEDLKRSCCSPNKAVQLEALKCWNIWINHQNPDDWKLNTVCFTGVRPLITKKLQPLHKDVDICKMKLSLMWALLRKVQNLMQFEGPQYILEVFLQSCLTWLSSDSVDGCENEISVLIFQLLLGIFNKNETMDACDSETFPPLSTDLFHGKKVFHRFVDKFLNIFIHWRIIPDKSIFLKFWKYFLEHCELSCEYIPTPLWHSIFKLASQICSEKNETIKVRLAVLHSCATSLKSALSSSKFMDFGTLLATPCEALLKKLVELCRVECDEFYDLEMFMHSKEICEVLLSKSVTFEGFDLCINVLDVLEEFYLRSLFWGVWCGLVYCYKVLLLDLDKNHFTRIQLKFYRKLRGIAINFELDRNKLYKDCVIEVEKNINILNISCLCTLRSISKIENTKVKDCSINVTEMDLVRVETKNQLSQNFDSPALFQSEINGSLKEAKDRSLAMFSAAAFYRKSHVLPRKSVIVKVGVIKEILKTTGLNPIKPLLNDLFNFNIINLKMTRHNLFNLLNDRNDFSLNFEAGSDSKNQTNKAVCCLKAKAPLSVSEPKHDKKNDVLVFKRNKKAKIEEEFISVRSTRSRKRAEEEKRKEMERQKRKQRKSFEVLVQEIVRKNKERKTEKNCEQRKSSVGLRSRLRMKKKIKEEFKKKNQTERKKKGKKPEEAVERNLKISKKEKPNNQVKKEKKTCKTNGKLENYFKVIRKKLGTEIKKEVKKSKKGKKTTRNPGEVSCCNSKKEKGEEKNETGWRQTSLKTMMSQRSKTVKVKQESCTRQKATNGTDEKQKTKKGKKAAPGNPLAKFSSFKGVFHDHEYAILEPEKLKDIEKIFHTKKKKKRKRKKKTDKVVLLTKEKKSNQSIVVDLKKSKFLNLEVTKSGKKVSESEDREFPKIAESPLQDDKVSITEGETYELSTPRILDFVGLKESTRAVTKSEKLDTQKEVYVREDNGKAAVADAEKLLNPLKNESITKELKMELSESKEEWDCQATNFQKSLDELTDNVTPCRRDRKRMRMLDSLKPSKKIKLEDDFGEEKFPLEIAEKENLEEKFELISPTHKEKSETFIPKSDGSPNTTNGRISSRALRMIALVPESTKGGQMQWETSPRVEIFKFKKAPNVDKNSRASKMLALLSENVVDLEESDNVRMEEVDSNRGLSTTPSIKAPVSSLKSPKSVKKRKFIRFDDTQNETVLYLTDTPPSQILEEKEKFRKTRISA